MTATRSLRLLTLLVALSAFTVPSAAQARERGPRIEVFCPSPPVPVVIENHRVLAYELHITNFDRTPVSLTGISAYGDRSELDLLQTVTGAALRPMTQTIGGTDPSAGPELIPPGQRVVIFMWIGLDLASPLPDQIVHRLSFHRGPGARVTVSDPIDAVLDNYVVAVDRRSVVPVLNPPFRDGRWLAGDGPANDSPHRRALLTIDGGNYQPERFAIDWVKVGPNDDSHQGNSRNEDFWAFGEPVLAIADGEIVEAQDELPDNVPGTTPAEVTLDNILGNHLVLRLPSGLFVTYAHLKQGSVHVKVHQRVRTGDLVGNVGNSGQTTGPHLHLQLTNGAHPLQSQGVPFMFDRYIDDGSAASYSAQQHLSILKTRSLPYENEVIDFVARASR